MERALWRAWPGSHFTGSGTGNRHAGTSSASRADVLVAEAPTAGMAADACCGVTAQSLGLAPRHCEVLYYLCQGLPNKSIANCMGISEGTVRKSYVSDLLRFFGVARRTELMMEVARRRLKVKPPG